MEGKIGTIEGDLGTVKDAMQALQTMFSEKLDQLLQIQAESAARRLAEKGKAVETQDVQPAATNEGVTTNPATETLIERRQPAHPAHGGANWPPTTTEFQNPTARSDERGYPIQIRRGPEFIHDLGPPTRGDDPAVVFGRPANQSRSSTQRTANPSSSAPHPYVDTEPYPAYPPGFQRTEPWRHGGHTRTEAPPPYGADPGRWEPPPRGPGFRPEHGPTSPRQEFRPRRVELPIFDGSNPDAWLVKVERYFAYYALYEEEKLEHAIWALDGDALNWFQWEERTRVFDSWESMKLRLLHYFRRGQGGTLHEQWSALSQETTVQEYNRRFLELSAPLGPIPDAFAMGKYVDGLKPEIKYELRVFGPTTLGKAMELAHSLDEKQRAIPNRVSQLRPPWNARSTTPPSGSAGYGGPTANHGGSGGTGGGRTGGETRRLSSAEARKKREKGLCYTCDEKWNPGHRCKTQLNVLIVQGEEDESDSEFVDAVEEVEAVLEVAEIKQNIEVSLSSIIGLTSPKTMKVRGKVKGNEVVSLIDSGATHNFISYEVVKKFGLPVTETGEYGVSLGSGETVRGKGICRGVHLMIQDVNIIEDFLPLRLGGNHGGLPLLTDGRPLGRDQDVPTGGGGSVLAGNEGGYSGLRSTLCRVSTKQDDGDDSGGFTSATTTTGSSVG